MLIFNIITIIVTDFNIWLLILHDFWSSEVDNKKNYKYFNVQL